MVSNFFKNCITAIIWEVEYNTKNFSAFINIIQFNINLKLFSCKFCSYVTSSQFGLCKFFESLLLYFWLNSKLDFKTDNILIFFHTHKHLPYKNILISSVAQVFSNPGPQLIS